MCESEVKARAVLYNNPYFKHNGKKTACIGNYECFNDLSFSSHLLNAIVEDAKNLGFEYLIGPMNGSTWDDYRFSLNHDSPTFFLEPYHHLYYNDQFSNFGFGPVAQYVSGISDCTNYKETEPSAFESFYKNGLHVRPVNLDSYDCELKKLYDFSLIAFKNNFLYTPISFEYFKEKYAAAKKIIQPDFFQIAEDAEGNIVGFMFCVDDLYNKKEKSLIIKTLARMPDEKWKGLTKITGDIVYKTARDKGYKTIVHAFMHQHNASTSVSRNFKGVVFRKYILYGKEL